MITDIEASETMTLNILCWAIFEGDVNKRNENVESIRRKMLRLALMGCIRVPFLFNEVIFQMMNSNSNIKSTCASHSGSANMHPIFFTRQFSPNNA
jgi:hypothetical protein